MSKPPIQAQSKTQFRRLTEQGANRSGGQEPSTAGGQADQEQRVPYTRSTPVQPVPPATTNAAPQVCCGEFVTCSKPCTPRGEWIAEQRAAAAPSGPTEREARTAQAFVNARAFTGDDIEMVARAVLRWKEQTKGATVDELSDLEITRLCAKAIKLCTIPSPKGYENLIIEAGTSMPYRPLHDRAQWAELVERFELTICCTNATYGKWRVRGWYLGKTGTLNEEVDHDNLGRAICLCVAKMQLVEVGK